MMGSIRRTAYWPAAYFVFAASGCAGLIYQSIWTQYLGLFLGHAAYAQSLVLAIFMGGMALGAWWSSRRTSRAINLIRAYAWVELLIGLAALAFHPVFLAVTGFAYDTALPALAGGWTAELFRWLTGTLLIFPQSILLGATFPLFGNGLIRKQRNGSGAVLSGLYFVNSIGAAAGALIATFVLLPAGGLPGAMRVGALLNIGVAGVAFLLSSGVADGDAVARSDSESGTSGPTRLLLYAAFVTGLTSFVYEIGWVRMLCLALGSTVHAFELMLAAFVGGLALGALWIRRRIDHLPNAVRSAGQIQIFMGIAALVSLLIYDRSFDWVAWFLGALTMSQEGYQLFNLVTTLTAVVIMAPTAFFAGMTLPLFTVAMLRGGGGEASVGRVYAADTIGAIVGVFAAVHLLIPVLGLKLTMIAAAAGDLALGIVLLRRVVERREMSRYFATLAACFAAVASTLLLARFDPLAMAGGVYRSGTARLDRSQTRVIYYQDGKTASVASFVTADGRALIATNGKVDASMQLRPGAPPTADESTMVLAAVLPLSMHPAPRTAAVIGFGSGLSTHTLLGDSRLQRVDTVEIEPAMYSGAHVFGEQVERAYRDPRSHIHFDDAKAYFASNQSRYDIILSEPSNPWVSGVSSLFSREFYRFIPRHLNPDGLLVQWVQQYEITDELVATIIQALQSSFGDFRIYLANNWDMLIVATVRGPLPPIDDAAFRQPELEKILGRLGLKSQADLELREVGSRDGLLPLFAALSQRSNSDFFPILSLEAPRARFEKRRATALLDLNGADLPMREVLQGLPPPNLDAIEINNGYAFSIATLRAAQIIDAMRSGKPLTKFTDDAIQGEFAFVRASVGHCRAVDAGAMEVDALADLAGRTIPFSDATHLRGVWSEPLWIDCATQPEAVGSMLHVLDALARRDFKVTGALAKALLEHPGSQLNDKARDWLLRATMLASIAQGEFAAVAAADAALGKDIQPAGDSNLQRIFLLAYADAHLHASSGNMADAKALAKPATAVERLR